MVAAIQSVVSIVFSVASFPTKTERRYAVGACTWGPSDEL